MAEHLVSGVGADRSFSLEFFSKARGGRCGAGREQWKKVSDSARIPIIRPLISDVLCYSWILLLSCWNFATITLTYNHIGIGGSEFWWWGQRPYILSSILQLFSLMTLNNLIYLLFRGNLWRLATCRPNICRSLILTNWVSQMGPTPLKPFKVNLLRVLKPGRCTLPFFILWTCVFGFCFM